ncbi:MAG: hypothetical protein HY613_08715 [Candidatus Rokubacteria bacterium]|nr:hypothetical protein [Candidatus Rokubacteria bacterium]
MAARTGAAPSDRDAACHAMRGVERGMRAWRAVADTGSWEQKVAQSLASASRTR